MHNLPLPEPVAPIVASLDGSYLFAGGVSGNIYTLLIPSGELLQSYPAHEKAVSCLGINGDSSLLVSGGDDGSVAFALIFQLVAGKTRQNPMLRRFLAHDGSVTAIASCALTNTTIITTSIDCTCKFWRLADKEQLIRILRFPCAIMSAVFDQMHTEVYAAGLDGSIYKEPLEVRTEATKFTRWPRRHDSVVVGLVMVNDGKNLVSAAEDGGLCIWETGTEQVILDLPNVNMSSVSNLVVANTGSVTNGISGMKMRKGNDDGFGEECRGFCVEELSRSLTETIKLEDVLRVAEEDRSRAIDMLESAIAMYERLLELILKEARQGIDGTF